MELRARQRTFDGAFVRGDRVRELMVRGAGAYMRAALANFGYALIILKVFAPEFAKSEFGGAGRGGAKLIVRSGFVQSDCSTLSSPSCSSWYPSCAAGGPTTISPTSIVLSRGLSRPAARSTSRTRRSGGETLGRRGMWLSW